MKQILIICDGILAKHFLERVGKITNVIHNYVIVAYSDTFIPQNLKDNADFTLHYFDPTSLEKLRFIVQDYEFDRCLIVLDNEFDTRTTLNNVKILSPELELYVVDSWGQFGKHYKEEKHIKVINTLSLCSSRLIGFLPDSPVFANNVGIGKGEIMEVKVPVGSSFAYKRVGHSQEKYKIPMIYRHNNYIVTTPNTVIMPNDSLLVVGEPSALRTLFGMIKKQDGQFPSPFGVNLYLLVDMKNMSEKTINRLLDSSLYLNENLQNYKLYIQVINPTANEIFQKIKELRNSENIDITIEYNKFDMKNLNSQIYKFKIGLIICDNDSFESYKDGFYTLNVPILTIGENQICDLKKSVVITDGTGVDEESSIIFDISSQLNLDIYLYYFNQNSEKKHDFMDNYKNLSKLFNKNLYIIDDSKNNPIVSLIDEKDMLQFVPFDEKILGKNLTAAFSKDLDLMYGKLKNNYQIFIPSGYEYENL